MKQSSSSPSSIPPSFASTLPAASFYERYETMFNCGGCIVEDDEPVAADEESNLTTEAISNWSSYKRERKQQESPPVITVTYTEAGSYDDIDKFDVEKPKRQSKEKAQAAAASEYFNRITNNRNQQPNIQMAIPISPSAMLTPQQRREQQQQEHANPITSTRTAATPSSPPTSPKRYDMFKVVMPSYRLKDRLKKERLKKERRHGNGDRVKRVDSDCTQDTQSMSESDSDDLSVDESLYGSEEQPPQEEQDTLVSILRRKVKLGPMTDTKTTDDRVRVRFEKDTKFPDPNERPSSTRKHVPRMSPEQKQDYRMMNTYYPPTTDRRRRQQRQLEVSSLLMTAATAGPSPLVIAPQNNHDEFRDSSLPATKKNSPNMVCSNHQERLTRRAQQNQYHPPHHRRQSSATAEELLLSHYYTTNQ
mmetsp:Transcript_43015/g.46695  ORF Transcript_43015/g.46695 Transcript_43015/m.46695 type:complete len:419 (-) Transcript_43015:76-1332(-)